MAVCVLRANTRLPTASSLCPAPKSAHALPPSSCALSPYSKSWVGFPLASHLRPPAPQPLGPQRTDDTARVPAGCAGGRLVGTEAGCPERAHLFGGSPASRVHRKATDGFVDVITM